MKKKPSAQNAVSAEFERRPQDGYAIRAKGLAKTYAAHAGNPSKTALEEIDLDIPQGCIFGLLGPNGAGKSTFINILAGTVIKSAGSLRIWDTDIDEDPRQTRANIGIVPQELNIDAFFSPREALELAAGMFGVPRQERRTDAILELVGLQEQQHAYARTLSGGMRRRLLVGKAMVHSPPILVLDEPTAGVDVSLRQKLWENIRALNSQGVTILLTTHYLEEAEALCDQLAIIHHGRLLTHGPMDRLMQTTSYKELHLTLPDGPPAALPPEIAELKPQMTGNQMLLRFDPAQLPAGQIVAALGGAGIRIGDIRTEEPDLEEVFLTLTREADLDKSAARPASG
jgi:ABC-2 type transport system ATP-binding protein